MRTTIEMPDELFRRAKVRAAEEGVTLRELVYRALDRELADQGTERKNRVQLPLIRSRRPGSLSLTNADIEDILAGP